MDWWQRESERKVNIRIVKKLWRWNKMFLLPSLSEKENIFCEQWLVSTNIHVDISWLRSLIFVLLIRNCFVFLIFVWRSVCKLILVCKGPEVVQSNFCSKFKTTSRFEDLVCEKYWCYLIGFFFMFKFIFCATFTMNPKLIQCFSNHQFLKLISTCGAESIGVMLFKIAMKSFTVDTNILFNRKWWFASYANFYEILSFLKFLLKFQTTRWFALFHIFCYTH